jgi:hypothetical protein
MYGKGASTRVIMPNRKDAHWKPRFLNTATISIYLPSLGHHDLLAGPNRGKAAANMLLAKLFAANALAA